ncbi:MAG TPA: CHRD domain-containing protein [Nitrososphaera sp.]|nr:CHRD domain-containing protein [Nitrososphaera sp.]
MSTRKISSVAGISTTAVLLILVAVSATAATTTISSSYAQTIPSIFRAILEGEQEVPPVDSNAKGFAIFRTSNDGTELNYRLIVANIEDVTAAHIHLAPRGENGDVVAFLFNPEEPTEGRTNGVLAEGTITSADLVGPLEGSTLSELIDEMEAGNTYVNVHTVEHPSGEIRGQIS